MAGLVAAIRLREEGIGVRVVDTQTSDSGHSYPCVLHPRTLRTLSALGVAASLEWRRHEVTHLSVYTEGQRRARLELPAAAELARGAVTLPKDILRQALLRRLSELGTEVDWRTRLAELHQDSTRVQARLVRSNRIEVGCPPSEFAYVDLESELVSAPFVIGADGVASTVRESLGIAWIPRGDRQFYVFCETENELAGNEALLTMNGGLGSSVYPFQSDVLRFGIQVSAALQQPDARQLRQLLASRMPWYPADRTHLGWSGGAELNPGVAAAFALGRAFLVGEAGHSTGLLGGHSLNVGMFEANELALRMSEQLTRPRSVALSVRYGEQRSLEWDRLFGLFPSIPATGRAQDWVKRNITAMLPHLPSSGDELDDLLDQLHVVAA
jgi:2-polyprenyl-6-methoxyphenol hydroxylase-like FAD-dependent oxidoreductase